MTSLIFEKLFKKFETYDSSRANIEVWLFTLVRNVLNDYYRWHRIRAFFSISEKPLEKEEEQKQLLKVLQNLDARTRELISLKYSQGFNNRQIAKITGLGQSNVDMILMRGIGKLKELLNAEEPPL
jgi:RNA polymerase sigma-70 factor (ECF subfamily)